MNDNVKQIIEGLTEDQQQIVMAAMQAEAIKHSGLNEDQVASLFADAKKCGSLKDASLSHANAYGVSNIEELFPDYNKTGAPTLINNKVEWVDKVMAGVSKQPFARVKVMFADITADTIRAKGYVTATRKEEDVFGLLKRTTDPTTIYKKQKLDRDDNVDITDFDVVLWLKGIMKQKLDEELARAILIGDGRTNIDPHKIDETCIRPIYNDDDLFTVKVVVDAAGSDLAKEFITTCIRNRKLYRGSGTPALFTTEDLICEMLLLEDTLGRRLYKSEEELRTILRVSDIIPMESMVGLKRHAADSDTKDHNVLGLFANLADYSVGTNKGGKVSTFEDFDIDYNQQKYLIETRCSGALTIPYSAMVVETVTPKQATFNLEEDQEDQEDQEEA